MSESVANASPVDQPAAAAEARYGGFWVRFVAFMVDSQLLWTIAILGVYLVRGELSSDEAEQQLSWVLFILYPLYDGYFLSSARMATPGKLLFGLYVTDMKGNRLNFVHAVLRHLAYLPGALLLGIGFVMIAFSARKQGMHDRIVGTLVHRRPGSSTFATIGMIVVCGILFLLVAAAGIWYSIGKSTVTNFVVRSGMESLYEVMAANKVPVQDYAKKHQAWPTTWEQVESAGGKNPIKSMSSSASVFVKDVQLKEYGAMVAVIEVGERSGLLRLAPHRIENRLGWTCVASAEIIKYAPEACGVMK